MSADYSKWTLNKIKKFIDVLMEMTMCSDVQELKDHIILESVWNEVGKKFDADEMLLKNLWFNYLHMQLFCPDPIYMNDITIKLIECLHAEEVKHSRDIKWNKIATNFDGVPVSFLRKKFYNLIKLAKTRIRTENVGEIIDYLHDEYIPVVISSDSDKILPRLKYNEGTISYVDTNIEIQEFMNESIDDHK